MNKCIMLLKNKLSTKDSYYTYTLSFDQCVNFFQELNILGVKSYTEYIIQVAALNTEGPGPVAYVAVVTAEGGKY